MRSTCLSLILFFVGLPHAHAVLGENINGVQDLRSKLHLKESTPARSLEGGVKVLESSNPLYTIREYQNAQGQVFAVTWQGVKQPDLVSLFGTYFSEYNIKSLALPKVYSRRASHVETSQIVVNKIMRMRSMHGVAYVQDLLPTGFNVETLQ